MKKHRWHAWDSNPGRQNGRRRRIHWAMAAPLYRLISSHLNVGCYFQNGCRNVVVLHTHHDLLVHCQLGKNPCQCDKFWYKSVPNSFCLLGYFELHHFISKNYWVDFKDNFGVKWHFLFQHLDTLPANDNYYCLGCIFDCRENGLAYRVSRGPVQAAHHQVRLCQRWLHCGLL